MSRRSIVSSLPIIKGSVDSNPAGKNGRWIDCSRSSTIRLMIAVIAVIAITQVAVAFQGDSIPGVSHDIAERRSDRDLAPLQHDGRLDDLARDYLMRIVNEQDLEALSGLGDIGMPASDARDSLGWPDSIEIAAGISVGYGTSLEASRRQAIDSRDGRLALLDRAYELYGAASTRIETEHGWRASAPDGPGIQVDLQGYWLFVLVTAGAPS